MNDRFVPFVAMHARAAVLVTIPLLATVAGCSAAPTPAEEESTTPEESVATDDGGANASSTAEDGAAAKSRLVEDQVQCNGVGVGDNASKCDVCLQQKATLNLSDPFISQLVTDGCNSNAAYVLSASGNDAWYCMACPANNAVSALVSKYSTISPYDSAKGTTACPVSLPSGTNQWVCFDPNCSGCRPPVTGG